MLDGQWPDGDPDHRIETTCKQYCGKFEQNNGKSDRHFYNSIPNLYPEELDNDPTLTEIDPTILEVYIDNTCNLKCIYCIPELSSGIHAEMKKFGRFEKHGLILETKYKHPENFDKIQEKFWQWMENNAYKLKRLQLLGGEPFYQTQFDKFLELFESYPCPNLELNIVTNLMISKSKLKNYIDIIKKLIMNKKLGRLDITASIDCWGPQQEFVRYGIELTKWEENFKYLISEKWIKLNINNTTSVLTIKTLPELLCKLEEWTKDRKIEHYFAQLFYPSYMAPDILGPKEFQEEFKCILSLMETQSWRGAQVKEHFEALVNNVNAGRFNSKEVLKLLTYLNELDKRRKTNWRELFPWLIKYEDLCGIQE
jgi:organic radical activating enzyme